MGQKKVAKVVDVRGVSMYLGPENRSCIGRR